VRWRLHFTQHPAVYRGSLTLLWRVHLACGADVKVWTMKYRLLADTGLFVSELCLGTMTFGGHAQIWEPLAAGSTGGRRARHRALEGGSNFIDHRETSTPRGESETMLGRRSKSRRDIVLATKVRGRTGPGPNQVGPHVRHHRGVGRGASSDRTDYIDLYQIHRPDVLTNLEDTLRALDDLVRRARALHWLPNLDAWMIMKALAKSRARRNPNLPSSSRTIRLSDAIWSGTSSRDQGSGLGLLV